jgi:hypothetical protein
MHFDDVVDALLRELTAHGRRNGGAAVGGMPVAVDLIGCGGGEGADLELTLSIPLVPLWYELVSSADPQLQDDEVEAFVRNDLRDQFEIASTAYLDILRGSLGVSNSSRAVWSWTSVREVARKQEVIEIIGTCRKAAN